MTQKQKNLLKIFQKTLIQNLLELVQKTLIIVIFLLN